MDPSKRITVREALAHPYLADAPPAPGGELPLNEFLELWDEQVCVYVCIYVPSSIRHRIESFSCWP